MMQSQYRSDADIVYLYIYIGIARAHYVSKYTRKCAKIPLIYSLKNIS